MFRFKYGKKHKYFPYGKLVTPPIIGWCPRTKQPIRSKRYKKKDSSNIILFIAIVVACFVSLFLVGCTSYMPVYDPSGSDSKEFYDDLAECRFVAQSQMSSFSYGYYEKEVISKCMDNRGYSILNTQ